MKSAYRDVHPAFFGGSTKYFRATQPGVQALSVVENHATGEEMGIGTAIFENALGGRVCVMGYAPFMMANDYDRFVHLQNVTDWLCGNKVTAKLTTPGKTTLFVREGEGALCLCVMNLSLDTGRGKRAAVRGEKHIYHLTELGEQELPVSFENGWTEFTLPTLLPFETRFFLAKEI